MGEPPPHIARQNHTIRVRFLLAATLLRCGAERADPGPTGNSGIELPEERPAEDYPMGAPRFHVLTEDGQVALEPRPICGPGYCADGAPDDRGRSGT